MLKQPVGFVKLTNVALIKYKANGKRFEIACFKNKVLNWRNGVEKNLAEVLQSDEIYTNAAQGEVAKKTLLDECFPGVSKTEIMQTILDKGEMQISQKERDVLMEGLTNDTLNIISTKIVHPKTKRAFAVETIKAAIKESGIVFNLNKSAKKQAMDAIKVLVTKYFVEKVGMLIKLVVNKPEDLVTAAKVAHFEVRAEGENSAVVLVAHEKFADLEALVNDTLKGELLMNVLDPNFIEKGIVAIEKPADALMLPRSDPEVQGGAKKKKGKKQTSAPDSGDLRKTEEEKPTIANINPTALANLIGKNCEELRVCHTCKDTPFADVAKYKEHIKSDLHKFNLARKMKNEVAMEAEEFENHLLMQEFVTKKKGKK